MERTFPRIVELNHTRLFGTLSLCVSFVTLCFVFIDKSPQVLQSLLIRHPFKKEGFHICHVSERLVLSGEVSILYFRGFHALFK